MITSYVVYDVVDGKFLQPNGTFGRGCSARLYKRMSDVKNSMRKKSLRDSRYKILQTTTLVTASPEHQGVTFMDTSMVNVEDALDSLSLYDPYDKVVVGIDINAQRDFLPPSVINIIRYHTNV